MLGADDRGQLGSDQLLADPAGLSGQVKRLANAKGIEPLGQDRLSRGLGVVFPSYMAARNTPRITPVIPTWQTLDSTQHPPAKHLQVDACHRPRWRAIEDHRCRPTDGEIRQAGSHSLTASS
jgi:hypothetical protein